MADINDLISKEALEGVDKLFAGLEKVAVQVDKIVQSSANLDKSLSGLASSSKTAATSQEALNNSTKEAEKLNAQLRDREDEVVKAKLKFAKANQEQTATLKAQIVVEDQQAGTLEKLAAKNKLLRQEQQKLDLTTKEGIARNKELNKQIEANTKATQKHSDAYVRQKMNIGNYVSAMQGVPGPLGMATNAFKQFTGVIIANPIVAVIAAIVGIITILVKAFKSTEEGGDKVARVFAQIKAAVAAVFDRLKNVATILVNIFSGEGKLSDLKGAFKGLGDEIQREAEIAGKLADMMDKLEDTEINNIVVSAQRRAEIAKLREIAADQTKSEQERYNALAKAKQLIEAETQTEQKMQVTRIANALGMLDEAKALDRINEARKGNLITLEELDAMNLRTNNMEDLRKVNELIAQFINMEEDASRESRRLVGTMSTLGEEVRKQAAFEKEWQAASGKRIEVQDAGIANGISLAVNLKDTTISTNEAIAESNAELWEKKKEYYDAEDERIKMQNELKTQVITSAFNLAGTLYDRQLAKLDANYKAEVEAAGDNEELKEKIDEKYNKKRAEVQRKQARMDKLQAIFNIGVSTAQAIMKAYAQLGPIAGTVALPLILALAALQTAAVLAKPIPQFAKGTASAPGGLSLVGERGSELAINPGGQMWMTGDSPELVNLQRGTRIIPSDETRAILAAAGKGKKDNIERTIREGNKDIVRAIKEKKSLILNTGVGNQITERDGQTYKTYFQRHLS
jgi:hypothetical protein